MAVARAEVVFRQPVGAVWAQVGDFAAPEWIKGVRAVRLEGSGIGSSRSLSFADGAEAIEVLVGLEEHAYDYVIPDEAPLPVRQYRGRLAARAQGGGCVLSWEAEFEPDGMHPGALARQLSELFEVSLIGVRRRLDGEG